MDNDFSFDTDRDDSGSWMFFGVNGRKIPADRRTEGVAIVSACTVLN
jgi:hypothetical protein